MTTITPTLEIDKAPGAPSTTQLFSQFLFLSLVGFGGVLPLARRMIVDRLRWLTAEEFTDLLGLCQFLPGGNIINMSVAIGLKFRGVPGALAAMIGLIVAPTTIVIAFGIFYDRFHDDPHIRHLFAALAAAAAGLLVSMAIKIAHPLRHKHVGAVIALICFVAIAVLRFPLLPVMLVLSPISILTTWRIGR